MDYVFFYKVASKDIPGIVAQLQTAHPGAVVKQVEETRDGFLILIRY